MPLLTASDLQAIGLTLKVAALTTFILLLVGTPLAWWLARTQSWLKKPISALVAMPLVLIPMERIDEDPPLGTISPGHKSYAELKARLDKTTRDGFALLLPANAHHG